MCHPQLCNTLRKTGEVTYGEGDGAYREGEVKEVDAECRGKSGRLLHSIDCLYFKFQYMAWLYGVVTLNFLPIQALHLTTVESSIQLSSRIETTTVH